MISPFKKLSRLDIANFCNESRRRLSLIAINSIDFEPVVKNCEDALICAEPLQQAFPSGYIHEPNFMGVQIPLVWDVNELLNTEMKVEIKDVPVPYLRNLMSPELFDDPYGPSFSQGPIILAELPFCIPSACILDGNHRVLDAIKRGFATLPAKLYYDHDHVNFMSPYSKVLFGACCNIFYASLLVEDKISVEDFNNLSFSLE
jgi:hypothetical protein